MYTNFFAKSIMSMEDDAPLWGLFVWYDMFSWAGFFNWYLNLLIINWVLPLEIYNLFIRMDKGDWSYGTVEENNNIDMNRLGVTNGKYDPYNEYYWTNKRNGQDCNGKIGHGYYCYCPS